MLTVGQDRHACIARSRPLERRIQRGELGRWLRFGVLRQRQAGHKQSYAKGSNHHVGSRCAMLSSARGATRTTTPAIYFGSRSTILCPGRATASVGA
jgi:hypothetical protein